MSGPARQPEANSVVQPARDEARIPLLEELRSEDKAWVNIAPRYRVTSPDPPWKVSLDATLECLAASAALPTVERRHAEDRLGQTTYRDVPMPERQLLSLAHILLRRGVLSEQDLSERVRFIRKRLEASGRDPAACIVTEPRGREQYFARSGG